MSTDNDRTYEKRFRLTVVAKYVGEEPLNEIDVAVAQRELQELVDYAQSKFGEMPGGRELSEVQVEPPSPQLSVSERVDKILRALERKGFDVA